MVLSFIYFNIYMLEYDLWIISTSLIKERVVDLCEKFRNTKQPETKRDTFLIHLTLRKIAGKKFI